MKKTYSEKLRDPRWQKMRLQIMERDQFTCQFCRSTKKTLNIHHKHYDKGAAPWEYDESVLVTCCEECHQRIEMLKNTLGDLMGSRYDEHIFRSFVCLYERNRESLSFILDSFVEVGPELVSASATLSALYYSGYDSRCKEEEAE